MKKNRLFVLTALVLVSIFAFVSCTAAPTAKDESTASAQEPQMTENADAEKDAMNEDNDSSNMAVNEKENEDNMDDKSTFTGDAYNFELESVNGETYQLSDLAGKKVYIKLWASWCSICLAGLEEIDELYQEFEDSEDVVVLTMVPPNAYGEVDSDKFKNWYSGLTYSFDVLLDEGGTSMAQYGVRGFPTSVFIDTDGNVYDTKIGHVKNDDIKSILEKMS